MHTHTHWRWVQEHLPDPVFHSHPSPSGSHTLLGDMVWDGVASSADSQESQPREEKAVSSLLVLGKCRQSARTHLTKH